MTPQKPKGIKDSEITTASYNGNPMTKFPPELKKYPNLRVLSLSNTKLEKFPTEILSYPDLHTLDLGMTPIIEIPASISQLSNLKKLTLSYNHHTDLPASMEQLKKLQQLNMFYEYDLAAIPEVVGKITSLKRLLFAHSDKLSHIPENIGKLKKLEELNISDCKLITSIPESIGSCTKLKVLNLGDTAIKKLPVSISKLINLEELYINIPNLDLEDAFEKIKDLPKIKFLVISLQLKYPKNISILKNIKRLKIAENWPLYHSGHPTTAVPEEVTLMPCLESLNLSGTNNVYALPKDIDKLKTLTELHIGSTRIKTVPENLKKLKLTKISGEIEDDANDEFGLKKADAEKIKKWFPNAEVKIF